MAKDNKESKTGCAIIVAILIIIAPMAWAFNNPDKAIWLFILLTTIIATSIWFLRNNSKIPKWLKYISVGLFVYSLCGIAFTYFGFGNKTKIVSQTKKKLKIAEDKISSDDHSAFVYLIDSIDDEDLINNEIKKLYTETALHLSDKLFVEGQYNLNEILLNKAGKLKSNPDKVGDYLNGNSFRKTIFKINSEYKTKELDSLLYNIKQLKKLCESKSSLIQENEYDQTKLKYLSNNEQNIYDYLKYKIKINKLTYKDNVIAAYKTWSNNCDSLKKEFLNLDKQYNLLTKPKFNSLYEQLKSQGQYAYIGFLSFGEPDLSELNHAAELYLDRALNDPDYEVVKKDYAVKKTTKGYIYWMEIRGKNAFGAKVLKEVAFDLRYNSIQKSYMCTTAYGL